MSKKTDNPTRLSDIEKLLKELLRVQKTTLQTQQDIRGLLLDNISKNQTEIAESESLYSDLGGYLHTVRTLDETSQYFARCLKSDGERQGREIQREIRKDNFKRQRFWGNYLTSKGMGNDVFWLLISKKISYKDLLEVLGERHGYPKNITRCSSDLEANIRIYLKDAPESKQFFKEFLDEANKHRSNYAKVPVDPVAMNIVLDLTG